MFRKFLMLFVATVLTRSAYADRAKDPRCVPVSSQEFVHLVRDTPVESENDNMNLIARAAASHLCAEGYDEYTRLWKASPNDPHINLYRGMAAFTYLSTAVGAKVNPLSGSLTNELLGAADTSFANSMRLAPKSPRAMMEYGFYLCRQKVETKKGMALLDAAEKLQPGEARVHRLIGELTLLSDAKRSENELLMAVKSDANYATPHWLLFHLYAWHKRFHEARREINIYKEMVPPDLAHDEMVVLFESIVTKGLSAEKKS